ncbi:hypothetical protein [Scrofimicrobium sp. R131]|uniref:ATP synthase F1 complex delta/epsilon subunit N-terminal domain-containing protein n=1 Tax=Scrofimicrobium appendicitidis TaxID=3079930 RepID=A0AAU7V9Q6_9ACTO
MSKRLSIEVVNRTSTLWEGEADYVSIPALDGRLGVLPGRQPVLAVLNTGNVEVRGADPGGEVNISVSGGFASVDDDFVTVVVDEGTVI